MEEFAPKVIVRVCLTVHIGQMRAWRCEDAGPVGYMQLARGGGRFAHSSWPCSQSPGQLCPRQKSRECPCDNWKWF